MGIEELYMKFPVVLRDKLLNCEIKFPPLTRFIYTPLYTYRAVERKEDDNRPISRDDFKSYYELGKKPKAKRGISNQENLEEDPHYYGVSSFLKKESVEQLMNFPNPNKKMASGYVYQEGGPQETKDLHVCWWLYEDADVTGFRLEEDHYEK